jgi:hypothetical protein
MKNSLLSRPAMAQVCIPSEAVALATFNIFNSTLPLPRGAEAGGGHGPEFPTDALLQTEKPVLRGDSIRVFSNPQA